MTEKYFVPGGVYWRSDRNALWICIQNTDTIYQEMVWSPSRKGFWMCAVHGGQQRWNLPMKVNPACERIG